MKWRNPMRFRTALSLATLFVVCFTVASWATPVPDQLLPTRSAPAPDNPSQSGKIASIGDAAFSLEITQGQERKTMEFLTLGDLEDRKSTRLNSSHSQISYAVFCLKKKKMQTVLLMPTVETGVDRLICAQHRR